MIDREKVVNALKRCVNGCDSECPYEYDGAVTLEYCRNDLMHDALELLKTQETTLEKDGHHIRCLNCGEYWCDNDKEGNPFPINFCPNCGKRVKWE